MTDSASAISHLNRLTGVATALAGQGVAVYQHEYFTLGFGSFRLEVGRRNERWGFSWDGKDGYLSISGPYIPPQGRPMPPVEGRAIRLPAGVDGPLEYIKSFDFSARPSGA